MTTQVSQPLSNAEQVFKDLVWDPLIAAGEGALFTAIPVLNAPVLGAIDDGVIKLVSGWLFDQLRLLMDVTAIQLKNSAHQSAYESASEQLAVIADEQGVTSDAYVEARKTALADLARFTRLSQ